MEGTTDEMKSNESGAANSELQSDSSENSCDQFESEKSFILQEDDEVKFKYSNAVEETRSNCSSSNNLLQEIRTIEEMGTGSNCEEDADAVDEPENDNSDDAENSSAIELVENDSRSAGEEEEFGPPAKRSRISVEIDDSLKADPSEEVPSRSKKNSGKGRRLWDRGKSKWFTWRSWLLLDERIWCLIGLIRLKWRVVSRTRNYAKHREPTNDWQ